MEKMQTPLEAKNKQTGSGWYLRYLPFIAKPQHMQVEWLSAECLKNKLSLDELLPYLRLLVSPDSDEEWAQLKRRVADLDDDVMKKFLEIADLYIVAQVIDLIPELNADLTEVILLKEMPPYEQKPQKIMDDVFYAINNCDGGLLEDVALELITEHRAPDGFRRNYKRFKAILADEEFIRSQWPSAR